MLKTNPAKLLILSNMLKDIIGVELQDSWDRKGVITSRRLLAVTIARQIIS
jgi:hypothetical protein